MDNDLFFTIFIGIGLTGALVPIAVNLLRKRKGYTSYYIGVVLLITELVITSFIFFSYILGSTSFTWGDKIIIDGFSSFILLFISLISLLVYIASYDFYVGIPGSDSYVSIFFIVFVSSSLIPVSGSITLFFISWVTASIGSYVLVGIDKKRISSDAAVKYAIMGSVSTVFLVLWIGSGVILNGDIIWHGINPLVTSYGAVMAAAFLTVAGGFKLGIVPFHWWLPDVYTEGDGRIIATITGVVKLAVFTGFTRMVVYTLIGKDASVFLTALAILAVVTMTAGNIAAFTTKMFPRIMSYSSIAHIGYLLLGTIAIINYMSLGHTHLASLAASAVVVQIIAYSLSKPIAFTVSSLLPKDKSIVRLRGLWYKNKLIAFSLFISLMSLLGLPPLLGFWGKLFIFRAALTYSTWLVLIAIINSGASSYYYGKIAREIFLYSKPSVQEEHYGSIGTVLFVASLLIIMLGFGAIQVLFPFMKIYVP